jgi:chaperone required for assembly of F1-ATPase
MTEIFAAVDLASVATFVGATGAVIVAIALAMKGISLAKRAVNKA